MFKRNSNNRNTLHLNNSHYAKKLNSSFFPGAAKESVNLIILPCCRQEGVELLRNPFRFEDILRFLGRKLPRNDKFTFRNDPLDWLPSG